jgi:hypothetical protein
MRPLLAAHGRILIVNRTPPEDAVIIVAAAVVRHQADGAQQRDVVSGLNLGGDESVPLDALPPLEEAPEAVEVLLRLRVGVQEAIVDGYASARRDGADVDITFEVGVKRHDGVIEPSETMLAGFDEYVTYGIPAE